MQNFIFQATFWQNMYQNAYNNPSTEHTKVVIITCLFPPVFFVHLISKAHSVDHSQAQSDITLLKIIGLGTQLHLRLKVGWLKVLKVGVEEGVHQGRFANASFTLKGRIHLIYFVWVNWWLVESKKGS